MASPNRLGKLLRYMTDAVAYARTAFNTSEKVKTVLRGLAQSSSRGGGEGDLDYYSILAITNAAMLAGTNLIAERVSSSLDAFSVQEKNSAGEWVDVKDHEFLALLHKPNSLMEGSTFLAELVFSKILFGNHYWLVNSFRPGQGPISEILYLPAQSVTPRPDTLRRSPVTGELLIDYEYSSAGFELLPGESIVHFRNANPFDYWRGLSLLTALQTNLQINHTQGVWLADHYGDGNAIPSSVISVPADLDALEFEQVKKEIQEDFGGRHKTAITRAGEIDVKVIQHTIADMQILDAQAALEAQIRRILRVPEAFDSASSGQARLAAETALARDAVQPILNQIAEVVTSNLMGFYGRHHNYRLFADSIVPQDRAIEATEYQVYGQDRTLNENRATLDLPPIKLTGALAPYQILFDQIPPRYLPVFAPIIQQAIGAGVPGANGNPVVQGSNQQGLLDRLTGDATVNLLTGQRLLDGLTGQLLVDSMTIDGGAQPGVNRQLLIAMMTGQGKSGESSRDFVSPGYQMTGVQSPAQLLDQLVGATKSMSEIEKTAFLYWVSGMGES